MNPPTPTSPVLAFSSAANPPPVSAQRIELSELPTEQPAASNPTLLQSINPLHQVKATLQVCVGAATLTVGELMAAKEQQVLVLDRGVEQPVDLLLEGQVVARGQLVAVDNQFAVRITELPLPLSLGKPHAA